MSFLWDIIGATREAIAEREELLPLEQLRARVEPAPDDRRFLTALRPAADGEGENDRLALIAEFKRSAPSSDLKHLDVSVRDYVEGYVRAGASALSILTEGSRFGGSLDDLKEARSAVHLPILRKDFVIGERQIYEAVEAGADAILLIAAVLADDEMTRLYALTREFGLDALVEIRDREELHRALDLGADLIGINNRNLETFKVDVETTCQLVSEIPAGVIIVSESGLETRSQLDDLARIGVHAALIGSALMNAENFEAKCRELTLPATSATPENATGEPALA